MLIVEDEALVSLALKDVLTEFGCEVVGAAARVDVALDLARNSSFDIAVLDVNIGGRPVDDVARAITARGKPLIFVTGYGRDGAPAWLEGVPVLDKPCQPAELKHALCTALSRGHESQAVVKGGKGRAAW